MVKLYHDADNDKLVHKNDYNKNAADKWFHMG